MVKEIKHNRLIIEFDNFIIDNSLTFTHSDGEIVCYHENSRDRMFSIFHNRFIIYLSTIKKLIITDLEDHEIIELLNKKYNKKGFEIQLSYLDKFNYSF